MSTMRQSAAGSGMESGTAVGGRVRQDQRLAQFLGWASLGLGIPQITMPGRFARSIGVRDDARSRAWTRVVGVRELAHATGILVVDWPRPTGWVWTRVAGDAMDLALLGSAFAFKRENTARLAAATGEVVAITMADAYTARRLARAPAEAEEGVMRARAAVTVRQPREEVYRFWHDFQNLPRFMAHLESVEPAGDGRLHWKAKAPAGRTIEWDAEVLEDRPNELIRWRSVDGGVRNFGSVEFAPAPGGRGTEIRLDVAYDPPGGVLGETVAKLFGEEPEQQVKDDLRRFKQVVETGDVVRSEGSPEGPLTRRLLRQRPAQPLAGVAGEEGRM
jgi:uncharacterized membrane protein